MNSKNELLVSIIKKSLNSFNLELINYSEEDAKFESKNRDYSIVYKIINEENQTDSLLFILDNKFRSIILIISILKGMDKNDKSLF